MSLSGALKNVVAVAAGLVDGMGWGNNAKSAIMRIGLLEMKKFALEFFVGVQKETFVEEVRHSSSSISLADTRTERGDCGPHHVVPGGT